MPNYGLGEGIASLVTDCKKIGKWVVLDKVRGCGCQCVWEIILSRKPTSASPFPLIIRKLAHGDDAIECYLLLASVHLPSDFPPRDGDYAL